MAMTDSAITLNEALAAPDDIDTSQGAVDAGVGGVKSAPPVLRVDFSERHSALLDLAQASGDFDVRSQRDVAVHSTNVAERDVALALSREMLAIRSSPVCLRATAFHFPSRHFATP